MKTKHCIAFAALAVAALSGCAGQKEAKVSTGINLANLDTTAVPGNDFIHIRLQLNTHAMEHLKCLWKTTRSS